MAIIPNNLNKKIEISKAGPEECMVCNQPHTYILDINRLLKNRNFATKK